ncbi:MAG: hypothetical protein ACK5B3_04725 [Bacteroidota bacterium]|jgi:hypothetical protein
MKKVFTGILASFVLLVNTASAQTASSDNTIALVESGDDISLTSTSVSGEEPEVGSFMVIELLSLTASEREDYNLIDWTTLSEKNNDYFTLERSSNGVDFRPITAMKGIGTSNVQRTYLYKDMNPMRGVSYYRLSRTDFDGSFKRSKVIAVRRHFSSYYQINPVENTQSGNYQLNIITEDFGVYELSVVDMTGKEVYTEKIKVNENEINHPLNLTMLKNGDYDCYIQDVVNHQKIKIKITK